MARSNNAPTLRWEWKDCMKCNQKFRYTMIDGTAMKDMTCQKCTYKTCPICQTHHQANGACCSKACTAKKREITNIERYGSSNVFASDAIKDRIKETLVTKYGTDHPLKSAVIKEKLQQTCIEKYGVTNPAKSDHVKQKMRKTCQDKYGVDFVFQAEEFKEAVKKTNMQNSGVAHHNQLPERRKKTGEILKIHRETWARVMLDKYGVNSPFQLPHVREKCNNDDSIKKRRATMRRNKSWVTSKPEEALYIKLCEIFGIDSVIRHATVGRWDIDFHITSIDTYVNMNGIYWHGRGKTEEELMSSDSKQDKTILGTVKRDCLRESWFKKNQKRLVIIWEDEIMSVTAKSLTCMR